METLSFALIYYKLRPSSSQVIRSLAPGFHRIKYSATYFNHIFMTQLNFTVTFLKGNFYFKEEL